MKDLYSAVLAETIMRRYPDPDSYPYRSWCYAQGFMLWGFIRLYEKSGQGRYKEYVMKYCEGHVAGDGTVIGFSGSSLDDVMAGSVLVWAYVRTGSEKYRKACGNIRRAFDDYPRNSDGGFWHGRGLKGEMWVDGLFMGLMFLARYGKYIGDAEYCFAETVNQLRVVFERCEKDGSGLLYHAYCENSIAPWSHKVTGKSSEVWSEGLGWYALILAEALELLPKEQQGYGELVTRIKNLHAALVKVQDRASGLWYQVVDKPGHPRNWHDTSGSAMFVYSMAKAFRLGLACDEIYTAAQRGFEGIKTKFIVGPDSLANIYDACNGLCVQLNYDAYVDYTRNVNCQEAVAAFLWAAVEMEQ